MLDVNNVPEDCGLVVDDVPENSVLAANGVPEDCVLDETAEGHVVVEGASMSGKGTKGQRKLRDGKYVGAQMFSLRNREEA